jgi:hypothetical protein
MPSVSGHKCYCERCGAELLSADPAPLCTACWVSDTSVTVPSLMIRTGDSWNGATPSRSAPKHRMETFKPIGLEAVDRNSPQARAKRKRNRRITLAFAIVTAVALMLAIVPAALSSTTPGPVHLGVQQTDKATDAVLADLYTLMADKVAGRNSPSEIVCPVDGEPYIYTQYEGVTTISCPDPQDLGYTHIYIRTDTKVPVVN